MPTRVQVSRAIAAPAAEVFQLIADVERMPENFPEVVRVKMLNDIRAAPGARFVETRSHRGREMETELEIAEYDHDRSIRMVADSHGTIWDTRFELRPEGGRTRLTMTMDAKPHAWLPRILNPIMKGMFRRGMQGHLDAVAQKLESKDGASG